MTWLPASKKWVKKYTIDISVASWQYLPLCLFRLILSISSTNLWTMTRQSCIYNSPKQQQQLSAQAPREIVKKKKNANDMRDNYFWLWLSAFALASVSLVLSYIQKEELSVLRDNWKLIGFYWLILYKIERK